MTVYRGISELLAYVEYVGSGAGSFTSDIPSIGEVLAYVEYTYGNIQHNISETLAYVEYVGSGAGSFTNDIPSIGEILAYVEYEDLNDIITVLESIFGPKIWMT